MDPLGATLDPQIVPKCDQNGEPFPAIWNPNWWELVPRFDHIMVTFVDPI